MSANAGDRGNLTWATSKAKLEKAGIHASETAWIGTKFDAVLDNNGTLDQLYEQITHLVQDHQPAKASLAA